LAAFGAAVFFGGSTTACAVAGGVAATGAGATVTVYDDAGVCARSTTGSARFGVGATAAGLDKRGTANAAPTITTTPASMSLDRRVSRRAGADGRGAEVFAGDVTFSAAGGVFSMANSSVRAGVPAGCTARARQAQRHAEPTNTAVSRLW